MQGICSTTFKLACRKFGIKLGPLHDQSQPNTTRPGAMLDGDFEYGSVELEDASGEDLRRSDMQDLRYPCFDTDTHENMMFSPHAYAQMRGTEEEETDAWPSELYDDDTASSLSDGLEWTSSSGASSPRHSSESLEPEVLGLSSLRSCSGLSSIRSCSSQLAGLVSVRSDVACDHPAAASHPDFVALASIQSSQGSFSQLTARPSAGHKARHKALKVKTKALGFAETVLDPVTCSVDTFDMPATSASSGSATPASARVAGRQCTPASASLMASSTASPRTQALAASTCSQSQSQSMVLANNASKARIKQAVAMWPSTAAELIRGVNDTWNSYQRVNKGRSVTTAEWKAARAALLAEHDRFVASLSSVEISPAETDEYMHDQDGEMEEVQYGNQLEVQQQQSWCGSSCFNASMMSVTSPTSMQSGVFVWQSLLSS
jgi:hypothetical protein